VGDLTDRVGELSFFGEPKRSRNGFKKKAMPINASAPLAPKCAEKRGGGGGADARKSRNLVCHGATNKKAACMNGDGSARFGKVGLAGWRT